MLEIELLQTDEGISSLRFMLRAIGYTMPVRAIQSRYEANILTNQSSDDFILSEKYEEHQAR